MAHQEIIRIVPGSRYAVLMLHGILGTPDHFRELLPLVPETWTVHALLLDGHGGGVKDFSETSMEKWKDQVFSRVEEILRYSDLYLGSSTENP
jgi:esterase/lipase